MKGYVSTYPWQYFGAMSIGDPGVEYETLIRHLDTESKNSTVKVQETVEKPMTYSTLLLRSCMIAIVAWVIIASFTLYLFLINVSFDTNMAERRLLVCNRSENTHDRQTNATAIASIITEDTDSYIRYAQVLGYSLRSSGQITCDYDMVMLHSSKLRHASVEKLHDAQWSLLMVSRIDFPESQSVLPRHRRYLKMFSKLQIFNMTQYAAVLYIDADALVVQALPEIIGHGLGKLKERGLQLGWSADVQYADLHSRYNAGVMLVIPSQALFTDLVRKINTLQFDGRLSEQAYLNVYFENRSLLLHPTMNVMPFGHTGLAWDAVKNDMHILHFTIIKPDCFGAIYRCWWLDRLAACRTWNRYANKFGVD